MSFRDADPNWTTEVKSAPDPTFNQGNYPGAQLGDYLSRPVNIGTFTWAVGADLVQIFEPWDLFFSHPSVKKRLDNYNLLRCKLKVKFVINGTPFHYGRAICSYQPWHDFNEVDKIVIGDNSNIIQYSQRPHIFLDPAKGQGGCLCLPFFHLDNWIHVTERSDFQEMGQIRIDSINNLLHANQGTDPITVSVFAWADDVQLVGPTLSLAAQSKDEFADSGPVSKVASQVADVANLLSTVPVIGPFAMATSLASGAVASIARLFGFSRPRIITTITRMKRLVYGEMATTDSHDPSITLAVTSKQELTIDPRTVGLSDIDELSIAFLTGKESFLDTFSWNVATSADSLLWTIPVTPLVGRITGVTQYHMTPMMFTSLFFKEWSGSIIYRFQVVASSFHRGRLRFVFDPVSANVATNPDTFNTNYNRIIDISEERDFEVRVSWANHRAYLQIGDLSDIQPGSVSGIVLDPDLHNGGIALWVLNQLASPDNLADIEINVFVKAGPDFELRNPVDGKFDDLSYFAAQSADVFLPQMEENAPEGAEAITPIGDSSSDSDGHKSLVFYGESYGTMRTFLKRYNYSMATANPATTSPAGLGVWTEERSIFPYYRGYDLSGIHVDSLANKYNYTKNTTINLLTPLYVGWRGSIRHKNVIIGNSTSNLAAVISRSPEHSTYSNTSVLTNGGTQSQSWIAWQTSQNFSGGKQGVQAYQLVSAPGIEIEFPFQSPHRFAFARTLELENSFRDNHNQFGMVTKIMGDKGTLAWRESTHVDYVSVGEDFQLFFFLNIPVMEAYSDPTTSS